MAHRMCAARRSEPSRDREWLFALEDRTRPCVPAAAGCALEVPGPLPIRRGAGISTDVTRTGGRRGGARAAHADFAVECAMPDVHVTDGWTLHSMKYI